MNHVNYNSEEPPAFFPYHTGKTITWTVKTKLSSPIKGGYSILTKK